MAGELELDGGEVVAEEVEDLGCGRDGDGTHSGLSVTGSLSGDGWFKSKEYDWKSKEDLHATDCDDDE